MTMPPRTLRSVTDLSEAALIAAEDLQALEQVAARYAVAITPEIVDLIGSGSPASPIGRQFLPTAAELQPLPEESVDPIGDDAHSPLEGIVHRYPDRVLLKLVHVCAVYCRFCFRREMVGPGKRKTLSRKGLAAALDYIATNTDIWEVILSGGDPLVLPPARLRDVLRKLAAVDHVKVIRVHTRIPVVSPGRVTPALVRALKADGKATFVVLHANHPAELTDAARAACARFVDAGIPMLSQSVLLRGVNDDVETLAALMRAFVECRIKPYYLHHPDLAPGTAHLRPSIAAGQKLMRSLRGWHSGLCQPTYVLDIPGGHGKSPIGPNYLQTQAAAQPGEFTLLDYRGNSHSYRESANCGSHADIDAC